MFAFGTQYGTLEFQAEETAASVEGLEREVRTLYPVSKSPAPPQVCLRMPLESLAFPCRTWASSLPISGNSPLSSWVWATHSPVC